MRLAILGADEQIVELARAAIGSGRHQVVWLCELEPGSAADKLRAIARGAQVADGWDLLLDRDQVDAVLIARSANEDYRAQQLRTLVQVGMPLLVSHPVFDSMLVYYELDMIRRDTQCPMVPNLADRMHPAIQRVARAAAPSDTSPAGLEQLIFERHMPVRSKQAVQEQFARDVDFVRVICGELTRVTAVAPSADESGYSNLGVQMTGPNTSVARWSVLPTTEQQWARVTLLGSAGTHVLTWHDPAGPWVVETSSVNTKSREELPAWDPAQAALEQLEAATDGRAVGADWVDAARSVELTEAVDKSLRKGRTVELYYEDYTEEGTFKGTMTSLGCGLLIIGLLAMMAVALAEQGGLVVRAWPKVLLALLGIFLALQLLMLIFPSRRKRDRV